MPLSEVHQTSKKGQPDSTHSNKMANCFDLTSIMPEHELVELLWENGQIVVQGQSNRTKKSSFGVTEFAYNGRVEETDCGGDAAMRKFGKSAETDSVAHDLAPTVPCASLGMNAQDEGAAPWLNYPIDDSLHSEYSLEFFSELTGVNPTSLSNANNNLLPAERSTGYVQETKDSNLFRSSREASELSRSRTSQLSNLPQQGQILTQNAKSRVLDSGNGSGKCTYHSQCGDLQSTRLQKQDAGAPRPLQQSSSAGLMNFSHFSRPAALVKDNLNSFGRLKSHEKSCSAASTYPTDSTLVESTHGLKSLCRINRSFAASTQPNVDSESYGKPREYASRVHHSTLTNRSTRSLDRLNCHPPSFATSLSVERNEGERGPEAVVASSSVCSGYSAGTASNDQKHKSKKRIREEEKSGEHSDDLEDDSFAVKQPATGRGTSAKRSRAAEVHNLSERRRRDRINEKMRALQELIPNCNKVDKASMLDEAIEYLKTLQLQVQMMSMGSGYCMPSMMLPAGMNIHPMHAPPASHFTQLGVGMGMGMGMGMGFGMGMIDLNGSPGLIPVPPMHGTQFPCVSAPGVLGLHRMSPPSGMHSIGILGQRLPFSVPHAPLFSSYGGPSHQGTIANPLQVADTSPSSSIKLQKQCINLEGKEKASNTEPKSQTSQAVNPLMQTDSQELFGSRNVVADPIVNSSNTTETSSD